MDKQQRVASKVYYELSMFIETCKRLYEISRQDSQDQFLTNVYLQSFLIHSRNLRDFLTRSRNDRGVHTDDVLAVDFFSGSEKWSPPDVPPYLKENRIRLNRSLAHLSYDRLVFHSDKDWAIHTVREEIKGLWENFFAALTEEKQAWFISG